MFEVTMLSVSKSYHEARADQYTKQLHRLEEKCAKVAQKIVKHRDIADERTLALLEREEGIKREMMEANADMDKLQKRLERVQKAAKTGSFELEPEAVSV